MIILAEEIMLDRLKLLEENVATLEQFKIEVAFTELKNNKFNEWTLRYGFLETLQIVIDISCHLVSKFNLGNPKSYADCLVLLEKYKYITSDLKSKLIGMTGLRNILIHDYIAIDLNRLYSLLENLDDIRAFASEIKSYI